MTEQREVLPPPGRIRIALYHPLPGSRRSRVGAVRKRKQRKGKLMGKTAWTNEIRLTAGVQGRAPRKESRIALIWALKRSPWRTAASPHL